MLTEQERLFLRNGLPRGYGQKIAEQAGVSQQFVSFWFHGRYNSERVEISVLKLYREYKEETRKRTKGLFK